QDAAKQPTAAEPVKTAEEQRKETADAVHRQVGEMQQKGAEAEADSKFAAEVKSLYQQLKALIEQQRRRAKQQDGEMDRFAADVTEAGRQIDDALAGNAAPAMPAMPAGQMVNLSV
ncbi:MAG TPA: hypothetical protein VLL76_05120, partial [Candidatus Omnitrophota bacterium]|nr:hypothetical protein [Candidatus Omnitrophota bacterium]